VTGRGWQDRTTCKRGHDLNAPRAIGTDSGTGKQFCRLCRNERKLASLRNKQRYCRKCRKPLGFGRVWSYCSTICEKDDRTRLDRQSPDVARTTRLLALYDQLECASTPWDRADLRAKIAAELTAQESSDRATTDALKRKPRRG